MAVQTCQWASDQRAITPDHQPPAPPAAQQSPASDSPLTSWPLASPARSGALRPSRPSVACAAGWAGWHVRCNSRDTKGSSASEPKLVSMHLHKRSSPPVELPLHLTPPPCLQLLGGGEGWGQGTVAQAVQQGIRGRQLLQVPLCAVVSAGDNAKLIKA